MEYRVKMESCLTLWQRRLGADYLVEQRPCWQSLSDNSSHEVVRLPPLPERGHRRSVDNELRTLLTPGRS